TWRPPPRSGAAGAARAPLKFTAAAADIGEHNQTGQPVLIGTTSIEKNEFLAELLKRKGIPHQLLNAKNHQREAEIISQAGRRGAVTLATNIAGRGVDIILGGTPPTDRLGRPKTTGPDFKKWQKEHEEVISLGGLHVVGTERHEARRIDNQLRGRAGRQGDPGSSRFYVSLEDDIMRLFGGDQIAKIMTAFKLPEDTPIEHGMVSKAIENAQVKVETHNFDIRKHLVEYDDVANKQREIIYGMRRDILESAQDEQIAKKTSAEIKEKIHRAIENTILSRGDEAISSSDIEKIIQDFTLIIPFEEASAKKLLSDVPKNPQGAIEFLKGVADQVYESRQKQLGEKVARDIEKFTSLSVIDTLWIEHLDSLDDLREGIGLRAAGQRDPLVEYKHEAFSLFEKLAGSIDYEIVHRIFKVQVTKTPQIEKVEEKGIEVHQPAGLNAAPQGTQESSLQDPLSASDDELDREIARLEKEQGGQTNSADIQPAQDPNEMTDEQLNAEIARLEALESGSPAANSGNPYSKALAKNQPLRVSKVGRNDPCPCGSGLKWKKCGFINAPQHKG
ncbi:MAG: SEC-C metal-binding domain-containing protein, partial [Candidatus Curtissbacteria bacterium]